MINAIIQGIFSLIMSLVNLILAPIDMIISNFLPGMADILNNISSFFDKLSDVVPWLVSYLGINKIVALAIIDIYVFILTVPLMVSAIKLALAWYNKLKL